MHYQGELVLEYTEAQKLGKPCFIFLLKEDVPWLRQQMDEVTGEGERGDRMGLPYLVCQKLSLSFTG
ncbi:hypothetical protein PCC7424_2602 [Gloeothece citriformis PCC 7424]|uniref:Uncharacterized protein n=1 Tax=Gloeothece citriformis (strain PCC 7424) TaxID=65393 RepID=B7KKP7_GLOC7|nr:hypothetical protein [Gloeothece citriformis]ACK71016.1 hypothetical protein PCC7424_2602 [Gloeothece citriformis PCC 7424]